jgi:hypothetical protein
MLKKISKVWLKRLIFIPIAITFGCVNPIGSDDWGEIELSLNFDLNKDSEGFYLLEIDRNNWQTLQLLEAIVTEDGLPKENLKVNWESSHYWHLGDTLGYWVRRGLTNEMEWRNIDTSFVVGFNGLEVPTVNCCSYSNQSGEVRTMLAPVQTMIGDTMSIWVSYYDNWNTNASLVSKNFKIILE